MNDKNPPKPPIRNDASELRLLFELSQALDDGNDFSDHLGQALDLMARYTGMMRGTILLLDPVSGDITAEAAYGLSQGEIKKARYKFGEGITGRVIAEARPVAVPKISEEALFLNRTGARHPDKEEISFLCVPIMSEGRAVGALSADRLFADSVSLEEDLRLLRVIAHLMGRAAGSRLAAKARHEAVVEENRRLINLIHRSFDPGQMVGTSSAMRDVLEEAAQVAATEATVLIRGESGTGKEIVAGLIHANSPRSGHPFVKVNCAALPEGLIESELFGHERGAFTGAVGVRKGRFELAGGGTLFLDEVGDLTLATQAKLLRAVQEKEFERVGGTETLKADLRLIAATNRDLEAMVESGAFRQDLYYRLSVFPIIIPPLRERPDDIMPLVTHFMDRFSAQGGKKIIRLSRRVSEFLMAHRWPGNIRELENVVERAVILCGEDGVIEEAYLPPHLQEAAQAITCLSRHGTLAEALEDLEKRLILEALKESEGNMAKAARKLGLSKRVMGLRMKKYGFDFHAFRNGKHE